MKKAFIDDGYTIDAKLEETDWYPKVQFTYRPMLQADRLQLFQQIQHVSRQDNGNGESVKEGELIAAKAMEEYLIRWDVVDRDGRTVEINAANYLQLEAHLSGDLFNVVTGNKAPRRVQEGEGKDTKN